MTIPNGTSSNGPIKPGDSRTRSFWHTERDEELRYARTTQELPRSADVVIIGSGLMGAMTAYQLVKKAARQGRPVQITMVEADEVCGGATGRNGGHCKPMPFIGYRAHAAKDGPEAANQLFCLEEGAPGRYAKIIMDENIQCDFHITRAFDSFFLEGDAESAKLDLEARRAAFPEDTAKGDIRLYTAAETERLAGVKGAVMGASYPAGHMWPYKLATALTRIAIRHGMNLQTATPVSSILPSESPNARWTVRTARGAIDTHTLVVATNGYTSSVLPDFKSLIFPVRGTVSSITPADSHSLGSEPGPLRFTYGFRHGPGQVDYMVPRQGRGVTGHGDKSIILGGAKTIYLDDLDSWYGNDQDDELFPGAEKYFGRYMQRFFKDWDGDEANLNMVWTGVMGYSSDLVPYVGEIPGKEGVFIGAGYTGHGMTRIPACSDALSTLLLAHLSNGFTPSSAQHDFETALPKSFWMTKERLHSTLNVIKGHMGQGSKKEAAVAARSTELADESVLGGPEQKHR